MFVVACTRKYTGVAYFSGYGPLGYELWTDKEDLDHNVISIVIFPNEYEAMCKMREFIEFQNQYLLENPHDYVTAQTEYFLKEIDL